MTKPTILNAEKKKDEATPLDGDLPAFPVELKQQRVNPLTRESQVLVQQFTGINVYDHFATHAMQAILGWHDAEGQIWAIEVEKELLAKMAYDIAEAMVAERKARYGKE